VHGLLDGEAADLEVAVTEDPRRFDREHVHAQPHVGPDQTPVAGRLLDDVRQTGRVEQFAGGRDQLLVLAAPAPGLVGAVGDGAAGLARRAGVDQVVVVDVAERRHDLELVEGVGQAELLAAVVRALDDVDAVDVSADALVALGGAAGAAEEVKNA
jgi:hypothetical protein